MVAATRPDLSAYKPLTAEQIDAAIEQDIDSYRASFDKAFSEALQDYRKQQAENQKSDLRYVYICYLRTGITQGLPLFRIDLYNETDIEDMEESSADWDVPFSSQLYRRLPQKDGPGLLRADRENNRYAQTHWLTETALFFQVLQGRMPSIVEESLQRVPPAVQWYYGEYFDQCEHLAAGTGETIQEAIPEAHTERTGGARVAPIVGGAPRMRYFCLSQDKREEPGLLMNGISAREDLRKASKGDLSLLDDLTVMQALAQNGASFAALLDRQILMFKAGVKEVVDLYAPGLHYKNFCIVDQDQKKLYEYYFAPSLRIVSALSPKSERASRSDGKRYLDRNAIAESDGLHIFRLREPEGVIVVSLPVGESLLRREIPGILLTHIEVV